MLREVIAALPDGAPFPQPTLRDGEEYAAIACLNRVLKEEGTPYFSPLVLAALISLRTTCSRSARTRVGRLAVAFRKCFLAYGLETMAGWRPDVAFSAGLQGQIAGFSPGLSRKEWGAFLGLCCFGLEAAWAFVSQGGMPPDGIIEAVDIAANGDVGLAA